LSAGQKHGALPDVLIIGGQKCGTTYLYRLLNQHPLMRPAVKKEVDFFDSPKFNKGVTWYRSRFPVPEREDQARTLTGEASPYYLFHPCAARRASEVIPQAKLIALLRNPVDRAYSDYQDRVRAGLETLNFEEALEMEAERIAGEVEKILSDRTYRSRNHRRYAYRSRGIYLNQLQEWHRYFDRRQFLVLKSEEFFANPLTTVRLVHQFLALPEHVPEVRLSAEDRNSASYEPMAPATRRQLEAFFEPHNRRLYQYLGVDFGW